MLRPAVFEILENRRLLASFAPDLNFGEEGAITGPSRSNLVRRVDRQYFLGANDAGILAFSYDANNVPSIRRYTYGGAEDSTFVRIAVDGTTSAIYQQFPATLDQQGRVLVTSNAQAGPVRIGRYTSAGVLDATYGAGGTTDIPFPVLTGERFNGARIESVCAAPDGSAYVAATIQTSVEGRGGLQRSRRWLTRINADGTFDSTFGGGDGFLRIGGNEPGLRGSASDGFSQRLSVLAVDPQGRAVVGTREAPTTFTVRRFLLNGDPDPTFGNAGTYANTTRHSNSYVMTLDNAGRPLIATGDRVVTLFRLNLAGQVDRTFGDSGAVHDLVSGTAQDISNIVVKNDGKIVLHLRSENGIYFTGLTSAGAIDASFDADGIAEQLTVRGDTRLVAALDDGTLLTDLKYGDLVNTIEKLGEPAPVDYASSTGTLFIRGTDADDAVALSNPTAGVTRVTMNGVATDIANPVTRIEAQLGAGNNSFNSAVARVPTTVVSGAGNDTLVTGNGEDKVYAGHGVDVIVTNNGRDEIFLGNGDKTIDSGHGGGYIWTTRLDYDAPIANIAVRGTGTPANGRWDVILSQAKVDLVLGGARADLLIGGDQDNIIDLGNVTGDVNVNVGRGNDSIVTGAGNDTIFSGAGNDTVRSGAGNDWVYSDYELGSTIAPSLGTSDLIDLGDGNDRVTDAYGDNTILGGAGNDTILTGGGDDSILGGNGRDQIRSGSGNDTVDGQGSRDTIFGQDGDDLLFGGNHNDIVVGGTGNDTLYGNAGDDLLIAGNPNFAKVPSARNVIDGGSGVDRLQLESDDDDRVSIETLIEAV